MSDEEYQYPLYDDDIGAYRWSDPDTSEAAAKSFSATRMEALVLDVIRKQKKYGATFAEVSIITGIARDSISPRGAPLRRKGFIVDSGRRRISASGRAQIVWVAKEFADSE